MKIPAFDDRDTEIVIYPGNPKLVEYRVPLESGVVAKVILPIDFNNNDLARVEKYLSALVC
jgi:hypothetical protein